MSEKEKAILTKFEKSLPSLDAMSKERLLGIAEGIELAKNREVAPVQLTNTTQTSKTQVNNEDVERLDAGKDTTHTLNAKLDTKAINQVTGNQVNIHSIDQITTDDVIVKTDDGQVSLGELKITEPKTKQLIQAATKFDSTEAANSFIQNYDESIPLEEYTAASTRMYNQGKVGAVSFDKVMQDNYQYSAIPSAQLKTMYELGNNERSFEKNDSSLVKTKETTGTFIDKRADQKKDTIHMLGEKLANKLGIDINLSDELEDNANGEYITGKGIINLSDSSDNTVTTALHEACEFAYDANREGMDEVIDDYVNFLVDTSGYAKVERYLESYFKAYKAKNSSTTMRQAMKEMVFDSISGTLKTDEVLDKFSQWMDEQGYKEEQKKTIVQKIADFISSIAKQIKEYMNTHKLTAAAKLALQGEVDQQMEIVDKLLKEFDVAGENFIIKNSAKKDGKNKKIQYQIKQVGDTNCVFIDVEQDRFRNVGKKEYTKIAKEIILEKFAKKIVGYKEGQPIVVTKRSASEYVYAVKTRNNKEIVDAKLKASTELDNILKASEFLSHKEAGNSHPEALGGFDYYKVYFCVDGKYFEGIVNVLNGKRVRIFYDLTKIRSIGENEIPTKISRPVSHTNASVRNVTQKENNVNKEFSLSVPIEETKDLIAIHNISEEKLMKSLELGGFAMPSIAVMKNNTEFSKFGDITVVFGKDTISQDKNKDNKVYGADAWTPMFPEAEYKGNEDAVEKLADRIGTSYQSIKSNILNGATSENIAQKVEKMFEVKRAFAKGNNIEVVPELREPIMKRGDNSQTKEFLKDDKNTFDRVVNDEKTREEYINSIYGVKKGDSLSKMKSRWMAELNDSIEGCKNSKEEYQKFEDEFNKDKRIAKGEEKPYEDAYSYSDGLKKVIEENKDEYEKFANDIGKELLGKKGIRNQKELYTPSGNVRSFEQTHDEYTLDNIVKAMRSEYDVGAGSFMAGFGDMQGVSAKRYQNFDEMKKDSGRLIKLTEEEAEQRKKELSSRFYDIARSITINPDKETNNQDNAQKQIVEAVRDSKTVEGIYKSLKFYNNKATMDTARQIKELVDDLREMQVVYFESKPKRAVKFDEIKKLVIPDTSSNELKQKLQDNNITYEEYKSGDKEERKAKVNGTPDIRFSLDVNIEDDDIIKENKALKNMVTYLKQEFTETRGTLPDVRETELVCKKILRENKSSYDINTLVENVTNLYAYLKQKNADYDEGLSIAARIGKAILQESSLMDTEMQDKYENLRNELSDTKIEINDTLKNELADTYGSVGEAKKANLGRLKFVNEGGIQLDEYYQELCEKYPELFDEDTSEENQINAIIDTLDMLKPTVKNENLDMASYELAMQLYQNMAAVGTRQTFADKKKAEEKRKMAAQAQKYQKQIAEFKQERENEVKQRVEQESKKIVDKLKKRNDVLNQQVKDLNHELDQAAPERIMDLKHEIKKKRDEISDLRLNHSIQIANLKAKNQHSLQMRRDSVHKTEFKHSIRKSCNRLNRLLTNPTDKQHVPEPLKESVLKFVVGIDLLDKNESTESQNYRDLVESMKEIRIKLDEYEKGDSEDWEDYYMEVDPDYVSMLDGVIQSMTFKSSINDLSLKELGELDVAAKSIAHMVTNVNTMFSSAHTENLELLGRRTISDIKDVKDKKEHTKTIEMADNLLNTEMLTPIEYFERMGTHAKKIYTAIREGFNRRVWDIKQAQDYMKEKTKGINVEDMTHKSIKFSFGSKFEMTRAQLMELYCLSQRKQALNHILKGGITVDQYEKGKKKKTTTKIIHLNEVELKMMFDQMTDQEKRLAVNMRNFMSNECSDWGNAVSMLMYGYKKFTEKYYYPIKTDSNEVRTSDATANQANGNAGFYQIKNQGMTKNTVKGANNAIVVSDIFDTFTNHVTNMATYHAYCAELSDAMRWYNFRFKEEDSGEAHSVKREIERAYGAKAKDYFETYIKDINGEMSGKEKNVTNLFMGKFKAACVNANTRVAIQQPTAYVRAGNEIDKKYLTRAMAMKPSCKESQDNNAIALWKSWGYYDTMIGQSMKRVITGERSALDKISDASMFLASKADDLTWGTLYNAVKLEVKDTQPGLSGEELKNAINKRFDEIIDKTQVVDTTVTKSEFMRNKGWFHTVSGAFMSEPILTYNMLRRAVADVYQNKPGARKNLVKTMSVFALQALVNAAAQSIVDTWRDDDDDDWYIKYLRSLEENTLNNANVLGMIPYVKDIWNVFQGYTLERNEYEGISLLVQSAKNAPAILKAIQDGTLTEKSNYSKLKSFVNGVSKISGIPLYNVYRDAFEPFIRIAKGGQIVPSSATKISEELYAAMVEQDTDEYAKQKNKLKELGKTDKEIDTLLRTQLKKNDERVTQAAELKNQGKLEETMELVKEIKSDGVPYDLVITCVNSKAMSLKAKEKKQQMDKTSNSVENNEEDKASFYQTKDIVTVLDTSGANEANQTIEDLLKEKTEGLSGKEKEEEEKKIRTSVKSKLTSTYKTLYEEAKTTSEKLKIRDKLIEIRFKGVRLYKMEDLQKWNEKK